MSCCLFLRPQENQSSGPPIGPFPAPHKLHLKQVVRQWFHCPAVNFLGSQRWLKPTCFRQDVETTVSGPGHVHHGGVSITSILGNASKPLDEFDHVSPHSRRGGSLKGGSKFWGLSESSPRRGGSYHGGNTFRGEGSYRGGARRGNSVHGGSVYRGGGPNHLTIDIEGLSQRGSRGAPSPLGNGGGLVRTSSNTNTPLLAEQGPTFVYHGRPVGLPPAGAKSFDVETGEGVSRGLRAGRESARGGNLFLQLQEKMQTGGGGEKRAPRDASDSV